MDVNKTIQIRRAYRSLDPIPITPELITDLAKHAQLSASCFNYQPWKYCFVYEKTRLHQMYKAISQGNEWVYNASMIIAVFAKKEDDCIIADRHYYLFDTGMATAFLILRATELGLVAHPIAGFSPKKTKEILKIPDEFKVITLVIVGKHAHDIKPQLTEKQIEAEKKRPMRKSFDSFAYINEYPGD